MSQPRPYRSTPRTAAVVVLAVTALSTAACGADVAGPSGDYADDQRLDNLGDGPFQDQEGPRDSFPEDYDPAPEEPAPEVVLHAADGEVVDLAGTVDAVVEPGVYVLDDPTDMDRAVLVVQIDDPAAAFSSGDRVVASGVAHEEFDLDRVEIAVGRDLDDVRYRQFEGRPYLEAAEIDQAPAA